MLERSIWCFIENQGQLSTLLRCFPSDMFLMPYRLWNFSEDQYKKEQCLLEIIVPEEFETLDRTDRALFPFFEEIRIEKRQDRGRDVCVAFIEADDSGKRIECMKDGNALFSVVGVQERPDDYAPSWLLWKIPSRWIRSVLSDHFMLQNFDIRISPLEKDWHWMWIRRPESFLTMKYLERGDIEIYHSFPEQKKLFTTWGKSFPLLKYLSLPEGEICLVLDKEGNPLFLDASMWTMAGEMISIQQPLEKVEKPAASPGFFINVSLTFLSIKKQSIPRIWLLEGDTSKSCIEQVFLDLDMQARNAIRLYVGEFEPDKRPIFVLLDDRPMCRESLFLEEYAVGFEPILPEEKLYIQSGFRVCPQLPVKLWCKEFNLHSDHFTLLIPKEKSFRTICLPLRDFSLLENYVKYEIQYHAEKIEKMVHGTVCEILFQPNRALLHQRVVKEKVLSSQDHSAQQETRFVAKDQNLSTLRKNKHPSDVETELTKIEDKIRLALRDGLSVSPKDWLLLSSCYFHRSIQEGDSLKTILMQQKKSLSFQNQKGEWLIEAFKVLDQVLYLDRFHGAAVALEKKILENLFQLKMLSIEETLEHVQEFQHTIGESHFLARLLFRFTTRWLLEVEKEEEGKGSMLRLYFYRRLIEVEEWLMIREHYIYVGGVAIFVDDQELLERVRLRYRRLLSDKNRLLQELPSVVK